MTSQQQTIKEYIEAFGRQELTEVAAGNMPPLLKRLSTAEASLGREQLRDIISLRYETAHFFEALLRRLINQLKRQPGDQYNPLLEALEKNLAEEVGEAAVDYGPAHVEGRQRLLEAIGVNYQEWVSGLGNDLDDLKGVHRPARDLLEGYISLIDTNPLAAGTAMLYYEGRIPRVDYPILIQAVEKVYGFPQAKQPTDTRWHLDSHAEHDVYHEAELVDGVVAAVITELDQRIVQATLIQTKLRWNFFWEDLATEIGFK